MAHQIIKQPNGRYCIYSSIVDDMILCNALPEHIVEFWTEQSKSDHQRRVEDVVTKLENGEKPYFQFTKSFDEMVDWIKTVNEGELSEEQKKLIEVANDEID